MLLPSSMTRLSVSANFKVQSYILLNPLLFYFGGIVDVIYNESPRARKNFFVFMKILRTFQKPFSSGTSDFKTLVIESKMSRLNL